MQELTFLSAAELLAAYRTRDLSPVEVLDAHAARIAAFDPALGAFTTLCLDRARVEAAAAEAAYRAGGPTTPLAGLPTGVKDLFDTAGVRTTYGSAMFADQVPTEDADAVRRVREAGAVVIGKTQTHEFAWGITSVNEGMGTSHNPWDHERISGGSSGGSAVALASHLVPLALGSDTGGSIRVPSNYCGTVGLKPTYGRISAGGVFPLAQSLDHVGAMARSPADAALLFGVLAGSADRPTALLDGTGADGLAGLRIGLCPDLHLVTLAPEIQAAFDGAVRACERLGAELIEVRLPEARGVYETFGAVQRSEALRTHVDAGLFPARRGEYGADVLGRLEQAEKLELRDYLVATVRREQLRAGLHRVLSDIDLLMTPVSAGSPSRIGEETVTHLGRELEFRELVMSYTVPQDLTGLPSCTVRAGFDALGIPTAVQFTGRPWSEHSVLEAAQALFEATAQTQARWPELAAPPDAAHGARLREHQFSSKRTGVDA